MDGEIMEKKLRLINISSTQTPDSKRKALKVLEEMDWDSLFLRLPSDWEMGLEALRRGFDFGQVVEEMRSLDQLRLPEDSHLLTTWRPLLEGLIEFEERPVRCIQDPLFFGQERSIALDLASLSLRARLGRIDVREWKELIEEEGWLIRRESALEEERLMEGARGESVCIDLGLDMEERLRLRGYEIEKVTVSAGWLPLELLRNEVAEYRRRGEKMPDSLIMRRIREHLEFLEKLISGETFDEAFASWNEERNGS
jgi:hypothetical protein